MKGKKLSKVLACLLAVVMIFTTLPMMAIAADVPYVVSYGSPAILMNKDTAVNLNDIYVEMIDPLKNNGNAGTVSGANITWAATAQDGMIFNATAKTVYAMKTGNYKLTATANGITKNVWVIAKEAAATDFNIVNYDFTKAGSFVPSEWNAINYGVRPPNQGTVIPTDGTSDYVSDTTATKGCLTIAGDDVGVLLINKNEIFKDFRDYTISYNGVLRTANNVEANGLGAGGRMPLAADGRLDSTKNSIFGFMRNPGTMRIQSHRDDYDFWVESLATNPDIVRDPQDKTTWYWYGSLAHNIKAVFDGENFAYYLDDKEIFDLSNADAALQEAFKADDVYTIDAGYPAIQAWKGKTDITDFTVKLNSNEMPVAENVTPSTPDPDPTPDQDPTPGTKPSKPNGPQTGDNTILALWAALLFVSGLGIFAITLFGRNKREEN